MCETIEMPLYEHGSDSESKLGRFGRELKLHSYELLFKFYGNGFLNNETTQHKLEYNMLKRRNKKRKGLDKYEIDLRVYKNKVSFINLVLSCTYCCNIDSNHHMFFKRDNTNRYSPVKINKYEENGTVRYTLTVLKQKILMFDTFMKEKKNCECEICYNSDVEFYTQPMFDCDHVDFCCGCIQSMVHNKLKNCPKCRRPSLFVI